MEEVVNDPQLDIKREPSVSGKPGGVTEQQEQPQGPGQIVHEEPSSEDESDEDDQYDEQNPEGQLKKWDSNLIKSG